MALEVLLALTLLQSIPASDQTAAYYHFACPSGEAFSVSFLPAQPNVDARAVLSMRGKPAITLVQVLSGTGAHYTDGYTTLWVDGKHAMIESGLVNVKKCEGVSGSAPPSAAAFDGGPTTLTGNWLLAELAGKAVQLERPATLDFSEEGYAGVNGHGGCNRFSGTYTKKGAALTFGALASTEMACSGKVMKVESEFLRSLANVRSYRVAGGRRGGAATAYAGISRLLTPP